MYFFQLSMQQNQQKKCNRKRERKNKNEKRAKNKTDTTPHCSRVVPHPSTKRAQTALTSVFGWEPVHYRWYGRIRQLRGSLPLCTPLLCTFFLKTRLNLKDSRMNSKHTHSSLLHGGLKSFARGDSSAHTTLILLSCFAFLLGNKEHKEHIKKTSSICTSQHVYFYFCISCNILN